MDHQRVAEIMAAIGEGGRVAGVLGDMLSVPPAAVADEVVDMPFLGGGPGAPVAAAVLEDIGADATVLTGAVGDPPTAGEVVSRADDHGRRRPCARSATRTLRSAPPIVGRGRVGVVHLVSDLAAGGWARC